jgi:hypothetical protein
MLPDTATINAIPLQKALAKSCKFAGGDNATTFRSSFARRGGVYPRPQRLAELINPPWEIGSRFRVQGLPASGGAEGDQGSKVKSD